MKARAFGSLEGGFLGEQDSDPIGHSEVHDHNRHETTPTSDTTTGGEINRHTKKIDKKYIPINVCK